MNRPLFLAAHFQSFAEESCPPDQVYNRRHTDSLNLEEFTALAKDWKLDAPTAAKVFRKYDKDKDGELSVDELKVVIEKTKS